MKAWPVVLLAAGAAGCGGAASTVPTPASTPTAAAAWRAVPNPSFRIQGASTPNAGWVGNEVWLTTGTPQGVRLFRSSDGSNQSTPEVLAGLTSALDGTGFNPTETVPRQNLEGVRELYVLGLAPPGTNRAVLFRLREGAGGFSRSPSAPVFDALAGDNSGWIGVPDVYRAPDGRLRLVYVDKGGTRQNARTAISADQGATFLKESTNPFGDIGLSGALDTNVDPAVLALASGGYLAITMRSTKLYIFTSTDGVTFAAQPGAPIEASSFVPGASGLFDPTLVQRPDGTVLMFTTLEDDQRRSSVVQATLRLP